MINCDNLKSSQKILLSLLETYMCNKHHIRYYLDYADDITAAVTLNRLKKAGYLKSYITDNSAIGTIYSLTRYGYEYICTCAGIDSYVINANNEMVDKYEKALKSYTKKLIKHNASVSDFYYILLKHNAFGSFCWEKEAEVDLDYNIYNNIRGDAQFMLNNIDYIIEQDMGTEPRHTIITKFSGYYKVLHNSINLQTILMPINFEYDATKNAAYNNMKKYKQMMSYLRKLRKELKKIKYDMVSINFDNLPLYEYDLDKFSIEKLISLRDDLYSLSPYIKKIFNDDKYAIDISIAHIEKMIEIKKFTNKSPYSLLKDKKDFVNAEIKNTTDELEKFKNEYIKKYNKTRYKRRIQLIQDIISTSNDFSKLLLKGMDFYVDTQENMRNFIEKNCLMKKSYKEFTINFFNNIIKDLNCYSKTLDYPSIEMINKYDIFAMSKGIEIKKYYAGEMADSFLILFEDISHGNYGAKYRVTEYIKNVSITVLKNTLLVLICDNKEQIFELEADVANINNHVLIFVASDIENILLHNMNYDDVFIRDNLNVFILNDKNLYPINIDFINNFIERS